jgi:hypothetical protein
LPYHLQLILVLNEYSENAAGMDDNLTISINNVLGPNSLLQLHSVSMQAGAYFEGKLLGNFTVQDIPGELFFQEIRRNSRKFNTSSFSF